MKQKRNSILTFAISCMPGAGQMFLGFFKEGLSLMVIFFGLFAAADGLGLWALHYFCIVVWFYAFFDGINKNSMSDEEFARLEDHFFLVDGMEELQGFSNHAGRKGIAVVLIVAGIYLLANNIFSALENLGFSMSYEMYQILTKNIPQALVSLLIIGAGIWLIVGKKKTLEEPEDVYLKGRDEE